MRNKNNWRYEPYTYYSICECCGCLGYKRVRNRIKHKNRALEWEMKMGE